MLSPPNEHNLYIHPYQCANSISRYTSTSQDHFWQMRWCLTSWAVPFFPPHLVLRTLFQNSGSPGNCKPAFFEIYQEFASSGEIRLWPWSLLLNTYILESILDLLCNHKFVFFNMQMIFHSSRNLRFSAHHVFSLVFFLFFLANKSLTFLLEIFVFTHSCCIQLWLLNSPW